jgi:hypothetical protein
LGRPGRAWGNLGGGANQGGMLGGPWGPSAVKKSEKGSGLRLLHRESLLQKSLKSWRETDSATLKGGCACLSVGETCKCLWGTPGSGKRRPLGTRYSGHGLRAGWRAGLDQPRRGAGAARSRGATALERAGRGTGGGGRPGVRARLVRTCSTRIGRRGALRRSTQILCPFRPVIPSRDARRGPRVHRTAQGGW